MIPLDIHAFSWGLRQAQEIAGHLNIACHEIERHTFPDGESLVTVAPSAKTSILYIELDRPNEKLFPLFLAADALRRQGTTRIVLVAPYLCYMRQDRAFQPGQAVSQQVLGKLFAERFDRIVTVDAHLHRTHDLKDVFQGIEAENLSAAGTIAEALGHEKYPGDTIIVGPDEESLPLVADIAKQLGFAHAVARKTRHGDRSVEISFPDAAALKGHPVILVDDIISSGTTVTTVAKTLLAMGASSVDVMATHALFPDTVMEEFKRNGIRSVRSTASVPHVTNSIPLSPLLAAALRKECHGENG